KRPGRHQAAAGRLDGEIEALQGPCAEQREIARLRENDLIDGEVLVQPDDAEADAAGDTLAVGEDEAHILLFPPDSDSLERLLGDPGELAPGIDEELLENSGSRPV